MRYSFLINLIQKLSKSVTTAKVVAKSLRPHFYAPQCKWCGKKTATI